MELSGYQTYGIVILQELRRTPGVGLAGLAAALGVSEGTIQQVVSGDKDGQPTSGSLVKAGLVESRRSGGYVLANPRHQVTVVEVVAALPTVSRPLRANQRVLDLRKEVAGKLAAALGRMRVDDL
ncbi:MAG: hypothetical protein NTZ17_03795 [Phycisphaerae bacterium]|nr:hypothetical protein [Phycisphaerae bacterium]